MLDPRSSVLLVALLASGGGDLDGGTTYRSSRTARASRSHRADAGALPDQAARSKSDAGIAVPPASYVETDAGTAVVPAPREETDGGAAALPTGSVEPDAGALASPSVRHGPDAGTPTFTDDTGKVISWPEEGQPLAILDGPAIVAAHAALQHLLARFPKEYAQDCGHSAKAMELIVGEHEGLYFVRINRRLDRCGWAAPGLIPQFDWFEFYAVSPNGRVLARYPYHP